MPKLGEGQGEPAAGGCEEVARLRAELVRAIARACPPSIAASADDLVQTVLMRLLARRGQGEGEGEFSASYLRKAAHCAVIDELRRRRRRRESPLEEEEPGAGPAAPEVVEAATPERLYAGQEVGRAIRECLRRLVRPRRLAATLHLQGHSISEVSSLMGWSSKKADNLVYRGMADLRACLAARGIAP